MRTGLAALPPAMDPHDLRGPSRPPTGSPKADTLSWKPASYENDDGETVEYERPGRLSLYNDAASEAAYLDDGAWEQLQEAQRSPLFAGPILHFLIRAFASDGIDELLAQITVIEAALGMPIDHDARHRPRQPGNKNPGATARVASRLSALLKDLSASELYRALQRTERLPARPGDQGHIEPVSPRRPTPGKEVRLRLGRCGDHGPRASEPGRVLD